MISKAPRHDDLITHYPMRACWAGRTAPRPMPKRRKSSAVTPGQRKLTGIGSLGVSTSQSAGHGSRFGECPICEGSFPLHALRSHADGCIGEPSPEPSTSAPTPLRGPSGGNALSKLKSTSGPVARVRIGGPDAAWRPCAVESLKDVVPDLPFALVERVMPPRDADALLEDLRAEATTWGQDEWWIAGEARKAPRLTAVYEMPVEEDAKAEALRMAGLDDEEDEEDDADGGSERVPPPGMRVAAERASTAVTHALRHVPSHHLPDDVKAAGDAYRWAPTYAVCNLYRDGSDRVGPHADQLTTLGPTPTIAGLSLGATRSFRLRRRWPVSPDKSDDVWVDVPLPHNSLAIMLPPCQELWTHEIVREGGGSGNSNDGKTRVSLTFRRKAGEWVEGAPTCECGRRCVLKTRRGDAPAPAFALNTHSDGVMDAEDGKTPVMYYYTCDPVNGGKPCKFYKPVKVVAL